MDIDSPPPSNPEPSSPGSVSSGTADPIEDIERDPRDHEPHTNCPDTLNCLPDTDGRPQHTLPVILRCAILGSPRRRLTIREIYAAMENKYAYYKTAGSTWKVCSTAYVLGAPTENIINSNPSAIIYH